MNSARASRSPRAHVRKPHTSEPTVSWFSAFTTYFNYILLYVFGQLRDVLGRTTGRSRYNRKPPPGLPPLLKDFEDFFTRRMQHRIRDCWNRPISSAPLSSGMQVIQRSSTDGNLSFEHGTSVPALNLGSYNYLGFADDWDTTCRPAVMADLPLFPPSTCTSMAEGGHLGIHAELEALIAEFVGKEDAAIFSMGFATNAFGLPAIASPGCLVISDSLNHNSIVNGLRNSGATVKVFKHGDYTGLESMLKAEIINGQPRSRRPWRKIFIVVEGIYSMEGHVIDLKTVVALAKKYKAYTFVDEAHSIGAMGPTGRGVCEHTGVDPKDVDILMGTFTKSFGAMGGYIAGSKELIAQIKGASAGFLTDNAMAPAVASQVLIALKIILGREGGSAGAEKIARLRANANYFRKGLVDLGLEVGGDQDSPIIPVMIYNPTKVAAFSRECLARGVAVVVVGYPATPVITARARFCVSAGHTKEDLDRALAVVGEVAQLLRLRYRFSVFG